MYEALPVFLILGSVFFIVGSIISFRFLYYYLIGEGQGHIQSLILAAMLIILSFQSMLLGIVASLIAANRRLNEDINYRLKRLDLSGKDAP